MNQPCKNRPRLSTNQTAAIGLLFVFVASGLVEAAPALALIPGAIAVLCLALAIRQEWRA